jgi:TonB family protein
MGVYLLKVNILLALFYAFYRLFFSRDTFFAWRRILLMTSYMMALCLPLLDVSAWMQEQDSLAQASDIYTQVLLPELIVSPIATSVFSITNLLLVLWIAAMTCLSVRFFLQLGSILHLGWSSESKTINDVKVKVLKNTDSPFSFFHWIFVNPKAQSEDSLAEVLIHEQAHARQWHSIDILFSELFTIFACFNPFSWLLKREVRINLEYLADEEVLDEGHENKAYQYHLLGLAYHKSMTTLSNNFNILPLKKRIKMMNKKRSNELKRFSYLLFLPLAGILMVACNLDSKPQKAEGEQAKTTAVATPQKAAKGNVKAQGKVYEVAEQMPNFAGGIPKLMEFLTGNVKYPEAAMKKGIEGRVIVSFVVNTDGSVSDAKVVRSIHPLLDKEALRVVNSMPKWTPGKQNGQVVRVKYNIPISFKLK